MDPFHNHHHNQHHYHQHHHLDYSNEISLPPGFRFHPTDEELISYYLLKKVLDGSFHARAIAEVDLNKCEPWDLPEKAKMGEKEWYFFSLRDRKYPTGLRTNRATEAGYWKATGKDREIYSSKTCALVGMKKTLVFYRGRAPKGEKSNWVMHEFRLEGKFSYHFLSRTSKDEWVISRVFKKSSAGSAVSGGGAKKGRLSSGMSMYPEVGSPSSVSFPPFLDSSLYAAAAGASSTTGSSSMAAAAAADRDSCSYDSEVLAMAANREHVSCFSTIINANCNPIGGGGRFSHHSASFHHELVAPPLTDSSINDGNRVRNLGLPAFPSLRSLQENLQLPFCFPPGGAAPPLQGGSCGPGEQMGGCSLMGSWGSMSLEEQKVVLDGGDCGRMDAVGATELDCLWSY
ncbi:hypothetical protein Nepgr_027398 [Nepenthes gracilis]|uniref:NAC domain-containing protein n=1 Tax=Nepenthes gracilis TaxID=150966 RepID=A0AAD3T9T0_NEPGR|nr:hypothetical protein Nepgr_027398 [Nepenthes gracilis]